MKQRLEDMNFQLGRGGMYFSIAVVVVPFVAFTLMISYAYIDELMEEFTLQKTGEFAGLLLFLFSLFGLILYAVTIPARQRFTDEGVLAPTWRGRRLFRWDTVEEAIVVHGKGGIILALRTTTGRCSITLDAYRKQRLLFDEIARRIPVQIAISAETKDVMQDWS
jgi:hypothetical protein